MSFNACRMVSAVGLMVVGCLAVEAPTAEVRVSGQRWVLSNDNVERLIELRPVLRTVSLTNKMAQPPRAHAIESREFLLTLDDGQFRLSAADFEAGEPVADQTGPEVQLVVPLTCPQHGVAVQVTYTLGEKSFYLRKRLQVDPGKHLVNRIDVELLRLPGVTCQTFEREPMPFPMNPWHIPVGRPVFAGQELFLGVEHPASYNTVDAEGWLSLAQHPGRRGQVTSDPAVIGFAPDRPRQRLLDSFEQYVAENRARPIRRTLQWVAYFAAGMDDDFCRRKFDIAERVFARRGVPIDVVLMDSGWTEPQSIMRINPQRPDRLALVAKLSQEKLGAKLGLHVITSGVKPMVDKDWIAAQGYDMIYHKSRREGAYCFADPRVFEEFTGNLVRYVRDYGVASYKFDWGHFECDRTGHRGHLPGVLYGFEAGATNFQRVHRALRDANPDVFLFNTGWYSPWWLWTYDACFAAGGDYNFGLRGPPSFYTGSLLCTYRDATVRGNLVRWSPFFPVNSLMLVDPISYWWHDWEVRSESPLRTLADYYVTACSRGSQMLEIYNNISAWDDAQADAVAQTLRWMKAHDAILLSSVRLFGGDMLAGEAYGYAHFLPNNRGLITVRNPTIEPRTIEIPFDETSGVWPGEGEYLVQQVYPFHLVLDEAIRYGSRLSQRLDSDEVRVYQVYPLEALPEPMPVGCRYQVTSREPGTTTFRLAAVPEPLELVSPVAVHGAEAVAGRTNRYLLKPAVAASSSAPPLPRSTASGVARTENRIGLSVDVHSGERARVAFVFGEPSVKAEMTIDGQSVSPLAPHLHLPDANRTEGPKAQAPNWSLYGIELQPGKHDIYLTPAAPSKRAPLIVTDFRADIPAEHSLTVAHDPLERKGEVLLPQNWAWEARRVETHVVPAPE